MGARVSEVALAGDPGGQAMFPVKQICAANAALSRARTCVCARAGLSKYCINCVFLKLCAWLYACGEGVNRSRTSAFGLEDGSADSPCPKGSSDRSVGAGAVG